MNDQKTMWNQKHSTNREEGFAEKPNEFAGQISSQLATGQTLLELGCGTAADAVYFASLGLQVTATDFSDVVIKQNQDRLGDTNPTFKVVDIAQSLPYEAGSFAVVYAHLSLHYYNQADTQRIFGEIARVLSDRGKLYFSCKSDHDPLYGEGKEVQPGVFDRNGHIRHFFSLDYTKALLADNFEVLKLEAAEGVYWGSHSAFVQCWAQKKERS